MVLPFLPRMSPTAQMLVWLMAAVSVKMPRLFTWNVWYQAVLAPAGPASPAQAAPAKPAQTGPARSA